MSATLIVPIGLILAVVRLCSSTPLPVRVIKNKSVIKNRGAQVAAFLVGSLAIGLIAITVIWGFYDFRFAMSNGSDPKGALPTWDTLLAKQPPSVLFDKLDLTSVQANSLHSLVADEREWTAADQAGLVQARATLLTRDQIKRLDELTAPPNLPAIPRLIAWGRVHELMPEAFLYGTLYAWHFSHWRDAFFNGHHYLLGSPLFFPYVFLIKTPLGLLVVVVMGIVALFGISRGSVRDMFYKTAPLWVLSIVYWIAAIQSTVNIGHRHILSIYPPLIVLGSAAGLWLDAKFRLQRLVVFIAAVWLAIDVVSHFPNYIAYVNGIVGTNDAYRHVVDSSLDWGQELPAIAKYADEHAADGVVTLSYFGSGSPEAYGVHANFTNCAMPNEDPPQSLPVTLADLPADNPKKGLADYLQANPHYDAFAIEQRKEGTGMRGIFIKKASFLQLHAGLYLISATRLQQILYSPKAPWGPWNERQERRYQQLKGVVAPVLGDDVEARKNRLFGGSAADGVAVLRDVSEFDALRFARLTAFLRKRKPDDVINGSVLVFNLSDAEISQAVDGPPPEFGIDTQAVMASFGLSN